MDYSVRVLAVVFALFILSPLQSAQASSDDALIERFKETRHAILRGNKKAYQKALTDYKNSPLLPYIQQAAISSSRIKSSNSDIEAFKRENANTYLGGLVHREQLRALFRRNQHKEFLQLYKDYSKIDLSCMHLRSLYKTGDKKQAFSLLPSIWLTGKSLPDVCDPIFKQWMAEAHNNSLIWQRAVLALEGGQYSLGKYLTGKLKGVYSKYGELLLKAYRSPVADLRSRPSHQTQIEDIISLSTQRLARRSPTKAKRYLEQQQKSHKLSNAKLHELKNFIAYRFSLSNRSDDVDDFIETHPGVLYEQMVTTQIRNAIGRYDLQTADKWINRLDEAKSELSWKYWQARAAEQRGDSEAAKQSYTEIAADRSYYGFLSAERMGIDFSFSPYEGIPPEPFIESDAQYTAMLRIKALFQAGELLYGRREIYHLRQNASADTLLKLAVSLDKINWHSQSILAVIGSKYWDHLDLRFPIDYQKSVMEFAKMRDISPTWIYAIMRQESALDPDAVSHADAYGLMQIIDPTAKSVARKIGISYKRKRLFDPHYNIRIGTGYVKQMRDRFGPNRALISTAYNAGPHRTERWIRSSGGKLPIDAWIESIPFTETRRYTQNIFSFDLIYRYRTGGNTSYFMTEHEMKAKL